RKRAAHAPPTEGQLICTLAPATRAGRHNYVHRNSLTFAQLLATLQAMREAFRTVAALRSALSTRGNLLLELLALHHQLGVLARSDRRFRPSARLLWACLRRFWPPRSRHRQALARVGRSLIFHTDR